MPVEPPKPKFLPNDYLDKAQKLPPEDPEGNQTLYPDLIMQPNEVIRILVATLEKALEFLYNQKTNYLAKV